MTRRTTAVAVSALALTLAVPVTAAHAGPVIPNPVSPDCEPIEQFRVMLAQIQGRVPLEDVTEMLEAWSAEGVTASPDQLVAYLVPTPGEAESTVVVGTGETGFLLCPVTDPLDQTHVQYEIVGVATESPVALADVIPAEVTRQEQNDPYRNGNWKTNNSDCFRVYKTNWERRVCWHHDQQRPDNDGYYHHRQFYAAASGIGNGTRIERMWVEAMPMGASMCGSCVTSAEQKFDGIPKPDTDRQGSEGCYSDYMELTLASGGPVQIGITRGHGTTTCENYLSKSYGAEEAHWAAIWEGNPSTTARRAVGLNMPVKTRESDTRAATWYLLTGQRADT